MKDQSTVALSQCIPLERGVCNSLVEFVTKRALQITLSAELSSLIDSVGVEGHGAKEGTSASMCASGEHLASHRATRSGWKGGSNEETRSSRPRSQTCILVLEDDHLCVSGV